MILTQRLFRSLGQVPRRGQDSGGAGQGVPWGSLPPNESELQPLLVCALTNPHGQGDAGLGQPARLLQHLRPLPPAVPAQRVAYTARLRI